MKLIVFVAKVAVALVRKPHLIGTGIRQVAALAPQGWWRSSPRLPFPRRDYMEFRQVTLSGDADQLPEVHDVIVYLEWCRSMRSLPGRV